MEGKKISRRSFLKVFGAGTVAVGTAGIAGCKDNPHTTKAQQEPPTDKMTYRVNPNTKDKVSLLGYGMMRLPVKGGGTARENPDAPIDQDMVNKQVDYALAHGVCLQGVVLPGVAEFLG